MSSLTSTATLPLFFASYHAYDAIGGAVKLGAGGIVSWAIPAGTYETLEDLCDAIADALEDAAAGDWVCSTPDFGASGITIRDNTGAGFSLSLSRPLAWFLSFPYSTLGVTTVSSTDTPPCVWCPSLPITDCDVIYRHVRTVSHSESSLPQGTRHALETDYEATAHYSASTLPYLRVFLSLVTKGVPFRMWVDRSNDTAWSEGNRTGYLDLVSLDTEPEERWSNEPAATYGTYEIRGAVL